MLVRSFIKHAFDWSRKSVFCALELSRLFIGRGMRKEEQSKGCDLGFLKTKHILVVVSIYSKSSFHRCVTINR